MYRKLFLFFWVFPLIVMTSYAQLVRDGDMQQEISKWSQMVSCFDYYTFGSIDVNLTPNYDSYQPGDPVIITGTIKNNNHYPVVWLTIKARLVKNIPTPDPTRAEIMILDEFDVADNIILDAQGEFEISYTHLIPLNAPAGQYQMYFYAVEQNRFNLSGLSFTNDIVASRIVFDVEGEQPDSIYLDQTRITVWDKSHNVMAFMTQHLSDTSIVVSLPLVNPNEITKQMAISYTLFSWDAANPANKITTKTEQITIPAKWEKFLTYTLEKWELPVYYLAISAEPVVQAGDSSVFQEKAISNIRFIIQDISKPRFNFVGVDSFPLKKDTESTLITCFHNTNAIIDTRNTTIETVVLDNRNRELSRTEYRGKVAPSIEGIKNTFVPKKDIWEFTVIAKMTGENGEEIDTVIKKYNCRDINPSICPSPETITQQMIWWLLGVIVFILLAAVVIWKWRNNSKY